jgi:hypothetical protein
MAPFSYLINKHGDDLAILWIHSHPDMGTGETAYPGFHAMVVSALTGHGDQELLEMLPATTTADRVALVGMHDWTDPTLPAIAAEWGLSVFSRDALRSTSAHCSTGSTPPGATMVAIHFDVDTIDADEVQLGLGADRGGLSTAEARRVVADIDGAAEVVALTIAEFIPRQVMQLQQILTILVLELRRCNDSAQLQDRVAGPVNRSVSCESRLLSVGSRFVPLVPGSPRAVDPSFWRLTLAGQSLRKPVGLWTKSERVLLGLPDSRYGRRREATCYVGRHVSTICWGAVSGTP